MITVKGFGPFYWGIEEEPTDDKQVSLAWLVETTAPYRKSFGRSAVRIRLGDSAFHFGICRRERDPEKIATMAGRELQYEARQIRLWGQRVQKCTYCTPEDPDQYCPRCLGTGYEIKDDDLD